ncbi:MAG: hypothetical protein U0Q03_05120 [Acidimicrobiales bacterium]
MPRRLSPRPARSLVAETTLAIGLTLGLSLGLAACGGGSSATTTTLDQREQAATLSTNPFIPEDANLGDCVSSLPRPGCGNEIRGDSHALLTFAVLVAGLTFIGWRIFRSVKRRDTAPSEPAPPSGA